MQYGERLADGFEMINGHTEINVKPACLRAPTATEIVGALRDNAFEPHDELLGGARWRTT